MKHQPSQQPKLRQRLLRCWLHFKHPYGGWVAAVLGMLVVSISEPLVPALLKPLLDKGFAQNALPLWSVPVAVIGIFLLRGLAHYLGQYALSRITNDGMEKLRQDLFRQLMRADLGLFSRQSASTLSNTIVYEVQNGAGQLVSAVIGLARDGFTLLALVGYLLWICLLYTSDAADD